MEKYIELAKSLGADGAKIISPATVVTAPWVSFKCQFGCGSYGKSWCCPPNSPDYKKTREILDCFETALLIHTTGWNGTEIAGKVSRAMFFDGYYKVIPFGSGRCQRCSQCGKDGCVSDGKAFPPMEACGIDVFATARNNGFPIEVLEANDKPHNCYALVLIE